MNAPPINVAAPSPQPALELIALAQLSPDLARQRLRALLLTNPNYFVKLPPTSFSAVLNIREDTTYESISRLGYDPETDQISAAIAVKQPNGYSSEFLFQGSEEFVRFYLSYDGGSKWRDLGMRSITVVDSHHPRPLAYEVALHNISGDELASGSIRPKIRAILSWSTPPPVGEPSWTPVWGHVAESEIHLEESQVIDSRKIKICAKFQSPGVGNEHDIRKLSSPKRSAIFGAFIDVPAGIEKRMSRKKNIDVLPQSRRSSPEMGTSSAPKRGV